MKLKRVLAYLLDIIFVAFISAIVAMIPVFNYNANEITDKTFAYYEAYLGENTGSSDPDESELIEQYYEIEKSAASLTIITAFVTFIYFGVIAYIWNGQTLGKKIMKIKVVPINGNKLNPSLFILRSLLITTTIPSLINAITLSLLDATTWYTLSGVISQIQDCIGLIILGFVIFRDDERGLHDLICKTKVTEANPKTEVE